ncbi:uncharacterized protein LOC130666351 [Microplitis mediator]|uniref:uncharacterized protein LOC130666351 n=1 Tax=Microplitis mediator TaxID=375433 RepID=UPI0025527F82|nr:uncharacterized protein LOC130666351 [Microplitis mediator]
MKIEIRVEKSTDELTKASYKIKYSNFTAALIILCHALIGCAVVIIVENLDPERVCSLCGTIIGISIYSFITIISYAPCGNIVDWGNRCKILRIFGIKYIILAVLSLLTLYTWSLRPEEDLIIPNEWNCSLQQLIRSTTISFAAVSIFITSLFWVRRQVKVVKILMLLLMFISNKDSVECSRCQAEIPFDLIKTV